MIPPVLDKFTLHGINGTHPCYVVSPALCSIAVAKNRSSRPIFQIETGRSLAAQLALAVEYIHARGFVHGDTHTGNMLLRLPSSLDQLSIKELYEKYGKPEQFEVEICDCRESPFGPEAPELAINPIWLGKHPEQYPPSEARLLVADFGETYPPSTESQHGRDRGDPHYALPPEMRFDTEPKYSLHSDIWALGCTICEIFSEYPLLYHGYSGYEHVIAKHVDILGKPPQEWWEKWEARDQLFTEAGERLRSGWATSELGKPL